MVSIPATTDGATYKYIMSVIDIFSRFLFLRPLALQTKETSKVAEHLLEIYIVHGPPEILQSPQAQGKDERSHRTWKKKIKFDLVNNNNGDLNWVEYLQQYQRSLGHHITTVASPPWSVRCLNLTLENLMARPSIGLC